VRRAKAEHGSARSAERDSRPATDRLPLRGRLAAAPPGVGSMAFWPSMGHRADHRLARPQPSSRQGRRDGDPNQHRHRRRRDCPATRQATGNRSTFLANSSDWLSAERRRRRRLWRNGQRALAAARHCRPHHRNGPPCSRQRRCSCRTAKEPVHRTAPGLGVVPGAARRATLAFRMVATSGCSTAALRPPSEAAARSFRWERRRVAPTLSPGRQLGGANGPQLPAGGSSPTALAPGKKHNAPATRAAGASSSLLCSVSRAARGRSWPRASAAAVPAPPRGRRTPSRQTSASPETGRAADWRQHHRRLAPCCPAFAAVQHHLPFAERIPLCTHPTPGP
jgi:hypothetical protein